MPTQNIKTVVIWTRISIYNRPSYEWKNRATAESLEICTSVIEVIGKFTIIEKSSKRRSQRLEKVREFNENNWLHQPQKKTTQTL